MPFSTPLLALVTSPDGQALTAFLVQSGQEWADKQMAARYGFAGPPTTPFSRRCHGQLMTEYNAVRSWFQNGKLSNLLMSKTAAAMASAPLGDGVGWDFKPDGDPDLRVIQFKTTLLAAERTAENLPARERHVGSPHSVGLARLVYSAYKARSEGYRWKASTWKGTEYDGESLAQRWAAIQAYTFFLRMGFDASVDWLWTTMQCQAAFGLIREVRQVAEPADPAERTAPDSLA
jgi:hypothetical protein